MIRKRTWVAVGYGGMNVFSFAIETISINFGRQRRLSIALCSMHQSNKGMSYTILLIGMNSIMSAIILEI